MAQLNEEILAEILERYKEKLPEIRPNEIYKWRAKKNFKTHGILMLKMLQQC